MTTRLRLKLVLVLVLAGSYFFCGKFTLPTDPKTAAEVVEGYFNHEISRRGLKRAYAQFRNELKQAVESTDEPGEGDRTGKCRLQWVDALVEDPGKGIRTTEQFTRDLFLSAKADDFEAILNSVAEKLEAAPPAPQAAMQQPAEAPLPQTNPMSVLLRTLHDSRDAVAKSFASLSEEERSELRESLYQQTTGGVEQGFLFADQAIGKRDADLLEKIDRIELIKAAKLLLSLADRNFLEQLGDEIHPEPTPAIPGVDGKLLRRMETADGVVLIGGAESNVYQLDELKDVSVIIDVGGDDHYIDGSNNENRSVIILIDLSGDDTYSGATSGIQGGAILGASLLIDARGNDSYSAGDVAQGSALGGVGILIDRQGDDRYTGDRRTQGQAIAGIGLLYDRQGDDQYRAALLSQAAGGPLGFGLLIDIAGNDRYFAGGKYPDPYQDSPGFGGWSQGVGIGAKGVANGGIGVLLDGSGDDSYEADYFSHGGGYWFGAGIVRDFSGNDTRRGATTENFDGSARIEPRFLRWAVGFGCHYAAGYVFDDDGQDSYQGDWAAVAYAWDYAVAAVCDFHGNDRYNSGGSGVAQSRNSAVAFLYDTSGDDSYTGKGLGMAEQNRKQATAPNQSSFSFFLDTSGHDTFSQDLQNNSKTVRGWKGGIFIDLNR